MMIKKDQALKEMGKFADLIVETPHLDEVIVKKLSKDETKVQWTKALALGLVWLSICGIGYAIFLKLDIIISLLK